MNQAYDALAAGRHGDPFSLLGPHAGEVRTFQPGARGVTVLARDGGAELGRLEQVHPAGIFAGKVSSAVPYRLRVEWPGLPQETEDPYSFGLLLGPLDMHLFAEGRHFELAKVFGAQAMVVEGVPGVRFALWAPNARRVSVVGDFNGWDGRRMPMRNVSGFWELFVPGLRPGHLYKYEILGADGQLLPLKADPQAERSERPPNTASIIAEPSRHLWQDGRWMTERWTRNDRQAPISIYEVHLGSWRRNLAENGRYLTYRELAEQL